MDSNSTYSDFFKENKKLLAEYIDLRIRLFRLQAVKIISRSLGLLLLILVTGTMSLFIVFFLGLAFSAWMAALTGSVALGHLAAAGLFLLLFFIFIIFRKPLFLNPLIRLFIQENTEDLEDKNH